MPSRTTSRKTRPWVRRLIDVVVIVFGILLAFTIDASWENRLDRAEEQEILRGLQEEYSQHAVDLEHFLAGHRRVRDGATQLLRFIVRKDEGMTVGALDTAMARTVWAQTWDPGNSILNAVVSSGRLELITSDELRKELARWQMIVDEVRDNQAAMRVFSIHVLWPAFAKKGAPFTRRWVVSSSPDPVLFASSSSQEEVRQTYEKLRGDPELFELISTKFAWIYTEELDEAVKAVNRILKLIEQEIK